MTSYLIGFSVYTLAMIGVILLGFVIVQKSLSGGFIQDKSSFMSLEQTLCLEPRRNIHMVKVGNERFLISTDAQGTKFLAKIDENNIPIDKSDTYKEAGIIDFRKKYSTEKIVTGIFEKISSYATNIKVSNKR
jgi:flagellar biogenesis protein FliO